MVDYEENIIKAPIVIDTVSYLPQTGLVAESRGFRESDRVVCADRDQVSSRPVSVEKRSLQ